ncbi:MAG TPA: aminodeoxychorismate synthase component I [Planctomycetota bacterium]|nr:aminodeoxychorismate synthase component I [Planctomycetota bacterium]HRR82111.1 aminodeoxychorismate synthase component I [Planctomycetota bacterium]HRT92894.1 aminodeoxychorismate synthase component I [Planctomycetota bacterium]
MAVRLITSARPATVTALRRAVAPGQAFAAFLARPHAFFLDSGLAGSPLARFSFLGAEPRLRVSAKGRAIRLCEGGREQRLEGNPFQVLRALLEQHRTPLASGPVPFLGGFVGYLGYDLCHFIERLPRTAADDLALPDMYFGLYENLAAYDHATGRWYAVTAGGDAAAVAHLDELLATAAALPSPGAPGPASVGPLRANFTRDAYLAAIRKAKDYIAAGDIFQVNLSQRFETALAISPAELYGRLRQANPAPFAAYLALDDGAAVLSSSPERFLKVTGRRVETRPIKGTRPRGATPEDDRRLAAELVASAKDAAELTMIVDLERNDLGRVCDYGSVRVAEHKAVEAYASVFHLVSTVEGSLHEGRDLVDLLKATFPGGSITGAPKIRSMEIIDELEPTQRSVYTGSIGYLGLDGTADLNIAIRTILVRHDRAYFQVGGGIVADSDPAAEYQETLDKGRRLFAALGHCCYEH